MISIDVSRNEKGRIKAIQLNGVSFRAGEGAMWYTNSGEKLSITVPYEAGLVLLAETFSELQKHFQELTVNLSSLLPESLFPSATLIFPTEENENRKFITLDMRPRLANWTKPWSFLQYSKVFDQKFENNKGGKYTSPIDTELEFHGPYSSIILKEIDEDSPVTLQIEELSQFAIELHNECVKELTANLNKGSLVTYFDFPPTVKVACEQYLQYFIQFLDDLGIEAESQIASDAGKVLFTVTPLDGEKALEAIQEALAAYLEMPKAAAGGAQFGVDVAQTQLHANVLHLQSQLMLAQSVLQMGQATIQAKDATINSQRAELALYQRGQQVQSIGSSSSSETRDSESLIPGYVSVTKMKIKGVEIDLPKIVRALKRKLPGVNN